MRLTCTVPADLKGTLQRWIQSLLSSRCTSFSWYCATHWSTCCSLKSMHPLNTHTYIELLWGKILSQDVPVSQSHITATGSGMNSFCSESETIPGWSPWKVLCEDLQGLQMDYIHRDSWYLGSICSRQACHFPQCAVVLSGMGGCSQWLNLDQDGSNHMQIGYLSESQRPLACCSVGLQKHAADILWTITKTCFWLDLLLCFVVNHICIKFSSVVASVFMFVSAIDLGLNLCGTDSLKSQ